MTIYCSLFYAKLDAKQGSCFRNPKKIQDISRPFHSIIESQFKALLPVDHSIAYGHTDTQEK